MKTKELIKEIQQLPINKRMLIVEHIIKLSVIRKKRKFVK